MMINGMASFLMWFIPLGIIPIDEMYAWSNNEKIHILFHKINEIVKATNEYDKAFMEVKELLEKLDDDIKEVVFEKLNEWINDGSLRTVLTTRKILIVGDSYVAGVQPAPNPPLTENFTYLLNYQGFDVTPTSSSGGGFIAVGEHGTFKDLIDNYNNNDTDLYTDIMFLGGVNDSYQIQSNLKNAIINTITSARNKFKNATIHIGYISQLRREDGNPLPIRSCIQIYKTTCLEAKCCYINNCETMLKNSIFISSDGIHPSADGHRIIANYLTSYLLNGNISTFQQQAELPFSLNERLFDTGVLSGSIIQDNNITRLTVLNSTAFSQINNPSRFTFDGNTSLIIGNLESGIIWGQTESSLHFGSAQATITGTVALSDTANGEITIYTCPMILRIVQRTLFVTPLILESVSSYKQGYLRQLNIAPFSAVFDSLDV